MAFLAGKQVLPDEIKIRDLAEQISLKSAQADPKSSELHKRLAHVLVTLQEHIRDRSFTGLLARLQLIAEKHRLKCVTQGQQFYLTSDSFFVELTSDLNGTVTSVKLCLQPSTALAVSPSLVRDLQEWEFGSFEEHLASLVSLTSRLEGVDRASAFKVLLAMESILSTVGRGTEHSSLVDVVLNGPVGHVTPRKMGFPLKLTIFASPYEYFHRSDLVAPPPAGAALPTLPADFGFSLKVSIESSTQNSALPIDPHFFSLQAREFQQMTPHNSVTLPITMVLHLSRDLPISAHTMFKIYKVVYSSDHAFQWPAGRHTDELVIREWAKGGAYSCNPTPSCDPDTAAAANTCHTVLLPSQCHRYFHGQKWSKQESIARHECAVVLSKIPFLLPQHVLHVVQLVRQQLVYNHLYSSTCGPPPAPNSEDCEDRAEFAFNVQGSPPESITLELDLLQKKEANVFFHVHISENSPFRPEVRVGVANQQATAHPILSEALSKCLSIPVLLRSALNRSHLLGPTISTLIHTYLKEVAVEAGPPLPKQSKLYS